MRGWEFQGVLPRKEALKWARYWSGRFQWSVLLEKTRRGYNTFLKFR